MKKLFLTLSLAIFTVFGAQAQIEPAGTKKQIPGTTFTVYYGDGYTNIYSAATLVYSNGGYFNQNALLLFYTKKGMKSFGTQIRAAKPDGVTEGNQPATVQAMFGGLKSTIFTFSGSKFFTKTGNVGLGASDGKVLGLAKHQEMHVRITLQNGAVAVYKINTMGGPSVVSKINEIIKAYNPPASDPFGGNGTGNDPFGGNGNNPSSNPFGGIKSGNSGNKG